jgi:DNA-binding response OmpR family regulator
MCIRILCIGVDPRLLKSRQMLLASRGYNATTATPLDAEETLAATRFDLVILSAMLSEDQKRRVRGILPPETKILSLTYLVQPDDLFEMVRNSAGVCG